MNGHINNVNDLGWTLETVPRDVFHMNELCEVGCCKRCARSDPGAEDSVLQGLVCSWGQVMGCVRWYLLLAVAAAN